MDPKLYALVVGIVATASVIVLTSGFVGFTVPSGFWIVLGSVVTLITTVVAGSNFRKPPGGSE